MLGNVLKSLAVAALACVSSWGEAMAVDAPPVTIGQGTLVGEVLGNTHVYFGIPYAASPTGSLRWRPPAAAPGWSGTRQAKAYGARCPQPGLFGPTGSENCLFINITRPATSSPTLRPVAVWIHGGAFKSGNGEYGGDTFARDDVIFVSMNYRLGPLGGLYHPALEAENPPGTPRANYGLLDIIAALDWVQSNIAAFGGDPAKITIFGESAGGSYVNYVMASPLAAGKFRGAIAESAANGLIDHRFVSTPRGEIAPLSDVGVQLASAAGLTNATAAQLRALTTTTLVNANEQNNLFLGGPVIDGVSLPDDVRTIFAQGDQNAAAYMAGANSFEATLENSVPMEGSPLEAHLIANVATIAPLYNLPADPNNERLRDLVYGDAFFLAQARYLVRNMSNAGQPAWYYHFGYDLNGCRNKANYQGVGHGVELLYVFDVLSAYPTTLPASLASTVCSLFVLFPLTLNATDRQFSTVTHGYWVNFMKNATPNASGFTNWAQYSPTADKTMHFRNNTWSSVTNLYKARQDYHEANFVENYQ